eukprot:3931619-Rhodomonas_salina.3
MVQLARTNLVQEVPSFKFHRVRHECPMFVPQGRASSFSARTYFRKPELSSGVCQLFIEDSAASRSTSTTSSEHSRCNNCWTPPEVPGYRLGHSQWVSTQGMNEGKGLFPPTYLHTRVPRKENDTRVPGVPGTGHPDAHVRSHRDWGNLENCSCTTAVKARLCVVRKYQIGSHGVGGRPGTVGQYPGTRIPGVLVLVLMSPYASGTRMGRFYDRTPSTHVPGTAGYPGRNSSYFESPRFGY